MNVMISLCSIHPKLSSFFTILKMMDYADSLGVRCQLMPRLNEALICRARNRALGDFWYGDFTHLMTVDDDINWPQDTIVELMRQDKDIIGGVYRLKSSVDIGIAQRAKGAGQWTEIVEEGQVVPADYVATGCMLVKREVVLDMINHFPELEYVENLDRRPLWALYQPFIFDNGEFREYLSEDWAFCERARMAGREIWMHGGVKGMHWGETVYTLDFEEPNARHS